MIRHIPATNTLLLVGDAVAYSMGITQSGLLVHTHFGAKLALDSDYPYPMDFPIEVPFSGRDENSGEEYPAWGGFRFCEPCLKVSFPDGARDVILRYSRHEVRGDEELAVWLVDAVRSIEVELDYRIDAASGVIARRSCITNRGSVAVTLEQAMSGALTLPDASDYRLTFLSGRWGAETQTQRLPVGTGTHVLESRRGHTSHTANPWFALDADGRATEERGEVYAANLAYSGNWKSVIQATPAGQLRLTSGIHDFDFAWELAPGESLETPELLLTWSDRGFGGASRNFHRHLRERVLPAAHRHEPRPVLYNSWEATMFDVSEENQLVLVEAAASLGVELFVIDDGWFGARTDDRAGLGDWLVNPKKFPRGLLPVARRAQELGMKFGLWVEPEMVNPDSELYRAHPDWVYRFAGREPSQMRNQLVLNLGRGEVREFIVGFMTRLLSDVPIDFIKWDMNRVVTEPGGLDASPERQKEVWLRHVQGLYEILGRLRAAHPNVWFEACSGGGGRVDPGALRFFDQAWISDNTDAYDRLFIQEGYSFAYPANTMVAWVTSPGGFLGQRSLPLAYRFHSAMAGVLGIGDDIRKWTEDERALARELIRQYKEIRPIVQNGTQYRILSPREAALSAVLYVAADRSEGALLAHLNRNHFRNLPPVLHLPGFDDAAAYAVDLEPPRLMSGGALREVGLRLFLTREYESVLVRIRRAPPPTVL